MKTFFLAVAILSQLISISWSKRSRVLRSGDRPLSVHGSGFGTQVLEIPDEPVSTRLDLLCAGHSSHGAPCTT